MRRWTLSLAVLLGVSSAWAQRPPPRPPQPVPRPVRPVVAKPVTPKPKPKRPPASTSPSPLSGRLGITTANGLLNDGSDEGRLQALERLGTLATPRALEQLAKALDPGGAARTSAERLTAVRALGPSSHAPSVRLALIRALGASGPADQDPLSPLVSQTAALALARTGHPDALAALGQALRQQGPAAEAASVAVIAHPPRDLKPLLRARGAPTLALISTLGTLGDQRAFHTLREYARRGSPEVRAAAAVELTRLGGYETVALAKRWLEPASDPALAEAAITILALAGDSSASARITKELLDPSTRLGALRLAELSPTRSYAAPLIAWLPTAEGELPSRLVSLLARLDDPSALAALEQAFSRPATRALAAHALATTAGSDRREALAKLLQDREGRAWAVRAGALREHLLGDGPAGLGSAISELLQSPEPKERAAAAWATTLLDPSDGKALVQSADEVIVTAVARLGFLPTLAEPLAARLAKTRSAVLRAALASALADANASRRVPTQVLEELLDAGGGGGALAARALASRDSEALRPKLRELLASSSPDLRAHTALGLGQSRDPTAIGLLQSAYRLEPVSSVRRAIVLALARHSDAGKRTLKLAADLDPDSSVRIAARRALGGRVASALPRGTGVLWLELRDGNAPEASPRALTVTVSSGLSLPLVSDPDGAVLVARLPQGPMELTVAPQTLAQPKTRLAAPALRRKAP